MNPASGPGQEGRTKADTHPEIVQRTQKAQPAKKVQPPADAAASNKAHAREASREESRRREQQKVVAEQRENTARTAENRKQAQKSNAMYSRRAGLKSNLPAGQIFDVKR